jgi:hypothetical protein
LRDDDHGQSEMLAFAWDVERNTRSSLVFIVPHMRDKRGGPEKLTDMRDVYENNTNNGARRLREAIFSILPTWYVEEAKDACARTLSEGGGKPLAQRIADAVATFGVVGITQDQLEAKVGNAASKWTEHDVAQLGVIYKSIQRGEVRKDEEFPPARVTAAEITGQQPPSAEPAQSAPVLAPSEMIPVGAEHAGAAAKPKGQPAPPAAVRRMEDLIAQLQLEPPGDVDDLIRWLEPAYTATRSEVKHVTNYLADWLDRALKRTGGDVDAARDEASTAIWEQMRAATEDDAAATGNGAQPGHGDG